MKNQKTLKLLENMIRRIIKEEKSKINNYSGPGGPTDEQITYNNKVLMRHLKNFKIPFKIDTEFMKKITGISEPVISIKRKDGKIVYAGYDRWGFVVDGLDIDQENLTRTVDSIRQWYFGNE